MGPLAPFFKRITYCSAAPKARNLWGKAFAGNSSAYSRLRKKCKAPKNITLIHPYISEV